MTDDEQAERAFQEACRWLSKSAPPHVDRTQWLISHGMLSADGKYLTSRAGRTLRKSKAWPENLMTALEVTDEVARHSYAEEITTRFLANDVASGKVIRLADGKTYVNAEYFDPQKHQRATDVHFLELNRTDITRLVAQGHSRRHQLSMLLAVADLTGWDSQGSPAVWLWTHEYLEKAEGGYRWTMKATRNKKLGDKLRQLLTLFSPGEWHV